MTARLYNKVGYSRWAQMYNGKCRLERTLTYCITLDDSDKTEKILILIYQLVKNLEYVSEQLTQKL